MSKYWPEFGKNGKETMTIETVMKHEAGMPRLSRAFSNEEYSTEGIKKNCIGKVIEEEKPFYYLEGSKREYHAVSRDWISNEIFRRIEPNGYTMGEYIEKVLNEKTGQKVLHCGASDEHMKQFVEVKNYSGWKQFKQCFGGPEKNFVSYDNRGMMSFMSKY